MTSSERYVVTQRLAPIFGRSTAPSVIFATAFLFFKADTKLLRKRWNITHCPQKVTKKVKDAGRLGEPVRLMLNGTYDGVRYRIDPFFAFRQLEPSCSVPRQTMPSTWPGKRHRSEGSGHRPGIPRYRGESRTRRLYKRRLLTLPQELCFVTFEMVGHFPRCPFAKVAACVETLLEMGGHVPLAR